MSVQKPAARRTSLAGLAMLSPRPIGRHPLVQLRGSAGRFDAESQVANIAIVPSKIHGLVDVREQNNTVVIAGSGL